MFPAALIPPLALVRTYWKAIAGGVALLAFVALFLALKAEQRHSAKLQAQLVKATTELHRISTKRDEQKTVTVETIAKADAGNKAAEVEARKIEAAPVKGDCSTPTAILESMDI